MAQCASSSDSALRRFRRHRPLSSCRNDNKRRRTLAGGLLLDAQEARPCTLHCIDISPGVNGIWTFLNVLRLGEKWK